MIIPKFVSPQKLHTYTYGIDKPKPSVVLVLRHPLSVVLFIYTGIGDASSIVWSSCLERLSQVPEPFRFSVIRLSVRVNSYNLFVVIEQLVVVWIV